MNLLEMLLSGGESEKTLPDAPPSPPPSPGATCPNPITSPRTIVRPDPSDNFAPNPVFALPELFRNDAYDQRMRNVWRQIIRSDRAAGMVFWLGEAQPELYAELTERLPGEIQCLWSEHASLRKFDDLLARFVETHQKACDLYEAHLANSQLAEE